MDGAATNSASGSRYFWSDRSKARVLAILLDRAWHAGLLLEACRLLWLRCITLCSRIMSNLKVYLPSWRGSMKARRSIKCYLLKLLAELMLSFPICDSIA